MKFRPVSNPPNPWVDGAIEYLEEVPPAKLQVFEDHTRQIIAENDSPDVGFRFSINPYRGCMHACAYCYARPGHEYLSFGAGTDFESKIVIKPEAGQLLREAFERQSWTGEMLVFSGVTDCYQPLEASLRLTRACLEVCAEYHNPVAIITKGTIIERDIDVLQELNRSADVHVNISIPFRNADTARSIEPHVSTPRRRLQIIERLSQAGIPVGVNVAPIIPGLNDEDIPAVLAEAAQAGASSAGYVLLRLPGPVKQVFEERLRLSLPLKAERILHRVRETRGGKLYDSRFGIRGRGEGLYAEAIKLLFESSCRRLGLNGERPERGSTFRRPPKPTGQMTLFENIDQKLEQA